MEDGKRHVGSQVVRMRKLPNVQPAIHQGEHIETILNVVNECLV